MSTQFFAVGYRLRSECVVRIVDAFLNVHGNVDHVGASLLHGRAELFQVGRLGGGEMRGQRLNSVNSKLLHHDVREIGQRHAGLGAVPIRIARSIDKLAERIRRHRDPLAWVGWEFDTG